jgi:hypothetical protein
MVGPPPFLTMRIATDPTPTYNGVNRRNVSSITRDPFATSENE